MRRAAQLTYEVVIRRNADGECRTIQMNGEWDDAADYLWTEGNYSCDCNRHAVFGERGGIGCSDELYTVLHVITPDGQRIAIEEDSDATP